MSGAARAGWLIVVAIGWAAALPACLPVPARATTVYSIDRFEPPLAVLISPDGRTLDVPLSSLPPEARPGDRLATPRGPVVGDRAARTAALRARLERLADAPGPDTSEALEGRGPTGESARPR